MVTTLTATGWEEWTSLLREPGSGPVVNPGDLRLGQIINNE